MDLNYYGKVTKSGTHVHLNGKGKVPRRQPGEAPTSFTNHIAESQVAQELPAGDYAYWEKSLFFPETSVERQERLVNQSIRASGSPENPNTYPYARRWALGRFIFRAGSTQNGLQTLSRAAFERYFGPGTSNPG